MGCDLSFAGAQRPSLSLSCSSPGAVLRGQSRHWLALVPRVGSVWAHFSLRGVVLFLPRSFSVPCPQSF